MPELRARHLLLAALLLAITAAERLHAGTGVAIFNVKDYGATGVKSDDARAAIQKAIDE